MKKKFIARTILVLSVMANVVLMTMVWRLSRRQNLADETGITSVPPSQSTGEREPRPRTAPPPGAVAPPIDFDDLGNLVSRLKQLGYSPATIRAIGELVVDKKLEARRFSVLKIEANRPYWSRDFDIGLAPQTLAAKREYAQERERLRREIFGADADNPDSETREKQRIYWGNIPAEKIAAIENIRGDYDDLQASLRSGQHGFEFAADRKAASDLNRQMESDVQKALTPAEYEEYAIRASATANWLRTQLSPFAPSENEFRQLYRLVSAGAPGDSPSGADLSIGRLLAAAQSVLSPDRYTELEQKLPRGQRMFRR